MRGPARRAAVALAWLFVSTTLFAQTPLLTVDLRNGSTRRIDDGAPKDAVDAELDAALAQAVGRSGSSFSTHELDRVYQRLLGDLRRERPRSPATLLVFLYPGRVGSDKLKTLSEVFVDLELVIDPCDRTVCRASTGKHIELVGRAVGSRVQTSARYKLVFRTLLIRTVVPMRTEEVSEFRVPIEDCLTASKRSGAGTAWLDRMAHAAAEYEPQVAARVAREAQHKGLSLAQSPKVARTAGGVKVRLTVRGSRTRLEQNLLGALAAAGIGLRENPATPATTQVEVEILSDVRGQSPRRFLAPGQPIADYLGGRLSGSALLRTYVSEVRAQAATISFDDETAQGAPESAGPSDQAAIAALSSHFDPLRGCVSAEAQRNAHFSGVTLVLKWSSSGRAEPSSLKESGLRGGALQTCLFRAVASIPLPRFSGAARTIEFPMYVRTR